MMTSRRAALVSLAAVLLATLALSPSIATAKDKPEPLGVPVNCVQLATDPAVGLAGNPVIKAATSTLIPASGVNKAHCRVDVLYGTSPEQNINIRAGLPLNSLDGGDRKSTRLNSSHLVISYAVFCLKKKKKHYTTAQVASAGVDRVGALIEALLAVSEDVLQESLPGVQVVG